MGCSSAVPSGDSVSVRPSFGTIKIRFVIEIREPIEEKIRETGFIPKIEMRLEMLS